MTVELQKLALFRLLHDKRANYFIDDQIQWQPLVYGQLKVNFIIICIIHMVYSTKTGQSGVAILWKFKTETISDMVTGMRGQIPVPVMQYRVSMTKVYSY